MLAYALSTLEKIEKTNEIAQKRKAFVLGKNSSSPQESLFPFFSSFCFSSLLRPLHSSALFSPLLQSPPPPHGKGRGKKCNTSTGLTQLPMRGRSDRVTSVRVVPTFLPARDVLLKDGDTRVFFCPNAPTTTVINCESWLPPTRLDSRRRRRPREEKGVPLLLSTLSSSKRSVGLS